MTDALVPLSEPELAADATLTGALVHLNNAHAVELSWLEPDRLRHLVSEAFVATRIGAVDAFLLALDQDAGYDSPNFLWFRSRYRRFVYVDRVVVASHARGRGHARRLYEDLFQQAVRSGHDLIVCEVNSYPRNPASDAFHAGLGFLEVGTAVLPGGGKSVRYLARTVTAARGIASKAGQ